MNGIYRAPHDSGQNEAERSNAAIGEALVDGRALKWEYYKRTDIMGGKEIEKLNVAEIKKLEAETMEQNEWRVLEEVMSRIDGEPLRTSSRGLHESVKRPSHGKLKLANSCWQTQVGVSERYKNRRQTRLQTVGVK